MITLPQICKEGDGLHGDLQTEENRDECSGGREDRKDLEVRKTEGKYKIFQLAPSEV